MILLGEPQSHLRATIRRVVSSTVCGHARQQRQEQEAIIHTTLILRRSEGIFQQQLE